MRSVTKGGGGRNQKVKPPLADQMHGAQGLDPHCASKAATCSMDELRSQLEGASESTAQPQPAVVPVQHGKNAQGYTDRTATPRLLHTVPAPHSVDPAVGNHDNFSSKVWRSLMTK